MNILIIDDSKTIAHLLMTALSAYGYVVDFYTSQQMDEELIDLRSYKFILLNTLLKRIDAVSFLKELRKQFANKYIIGINNKGSWKDKIEFLNGGADDVLSYPFPMQEVLARMQALLRRPHEHAFRKYKIGDLVLDSGTQSALLRDSPVAVKRKEYRLLEYMAANEDRPISRSELLDNVWDYRKISGSNTVDVHVNRLRRYVGMDQYIKTVHGFGYQLSDPKSNSKAKEKEPEPLD